MKLNTKVLKAINTQIGIEGSAHHFYLNFASYCDKLGYKHSAAFFYNAAKEENEHREKLIKYICERIEDAEIGNVMAASVFPKSLSDCFVKSYEKEVQVSAAIEALTLLAWEQKDLFTYDFLMWFVKEQRESEDKFNGICDMINTFPKDHADYLIEDMMEDIK
jgi:ferritin